MSNSTVVKNAEIFWAKLDKPVSPFGGELVYEAQFRFAKSRKKELDKLNLRYKEVDGKLAVNLKRFAKNAQGTETPVRVVDSDKNETDKSNIGNGSKVNFIVFQYEGKRGGVVSRLTAVQIEKLVEYKRDNADFDVAEDSVDF